MDERESRDATRSPQVRQLIINLKLENARLKALLAEASEALTPFALAASHQMVLAQASFNLAAVVWEKLDAAK